MGNYNSLEWYDRIPNKAEDYRDNPIKTVGELVAQLQRFDMHLPVTALWDTMSVGIWRVVEHEGKVLIDAE